MKHFKEISGQYQVMMYGVPKQEPEDRGIEELKSTNQGVDP